MMFSSRFRLLNSLHTVELERRSMLLGFWCCSGGGWWDHVIQPFLMSSEGMVVVMSLTLLMWLVKGTYFD